jgi:hypothetical protein
MPLPLKKKKRKKKKKRYAISIPLMVIMMTPCGGSTHQQTFLKNGFGNQLKIGKSGTHRLDKVTYKQIFYLFFILVKRGMH